jgi:hypothetical protein
MSLYRGEFERNVRRRGGRRGDFVIFVRVPACRRALPGDRIAVDTAETGEHQPPHAGRISSKSGVSRGGAENLLARRCRGLKGTVLNMCCKCGDLR